MTYLLEKNRVDYGFVVGPILLIINIQIISERYTLCMQLKISVFIAHGGKLRGQADGYNVRTAGGQEDDGFHGRHQHAGDQRMGRSGTKRSYHSIRLRRSPSNASTRINAVFETRRQLFCYAGTENRSL